jgi:hypothetical protein
LLGGELAFLIEPFVYGQFRSFSKENLKVLRGNMHMPGGTVDLQYRS